MNTQIDQEGKSRDSQVFKGLRNASLIIIIILALIFTTTMTSAVYYEQNTLGDSSGNNYNLSNFNSITYNETGQNYIINASRTAYLRRPGINISSSMTVCADINLENLNSNAGVFSGSDDWQQNFALYVRSAAAADLAFAYNNGTHRLSVTSNFDIELNQWATICGVYLSNSNMSVYYINNSGTLKQTNLAPSTNAVSKIIGNMTVGRAGGLSSAPQINGSIDDIYILNTSINSSDAQSINSNVNPKSNNVQALYLFNNPCSYIVSGYQINTTNNVFCGGDYLLNDTSSGAIRASSSANVNGNSSRVIGNGTGNGYNSNGNTGRNISNIIIQGFDQNFQLINGQRMGLYNIISNGTGGNDWASIYIGAQDNVTIFNITSQHNNQSHGIYIDAKDAGGTNNITIMNSRFYNNTGGAGIQVNSANLGYVKNLNISNSQIDGAINGIQLYASKDSTIVNNTISNYSNLGLFFSYNPAGSGSNFSATNNTVRLNTFSGNGIADILFDNWTNNNLITQNTYLGASALIRARINNISYNIQENITNPLVLYVGQGSLFATNMTINFSYSGIKNLSVSNLTITGNTQGILVDIYLNNILLQRSITNYTLNLQNADSYLLTESGLLYVNNSHASCSDSYSRSQASNPSTPWCDISAAETYALSGDTVIVADGTYRNINGYSFNANYNTTTIFQAQSNNTIITSAESSPETTPNTWWTNVSNSTNTNMWARYYSTSSSGVGIEYINTSQPILRCSQNNLSITVSTRGFECTYFSGGTNDTLYVDLEPGKNPRNIPFYFYKDSSLKLNSPLSNAVFDGFTIRGGEQQIISSATGQTKNITLKNLRIFGGVTDSGTVDFRRIDGLNFSNNVLFRTQLSSWWWHMIKQSNLDGETSAFFCRDGCNKTSVINNNISGYFNGIVIANESLSNNLNHIVISNNYISDVYDDGIELEGYGSNITIFNNTIYDSYVAISLTPFNATNIAINISYNRIHAVKRINLTKSGSTFTSGQNGAFKLLRNSSLVNAIIDHNSIYGERVIACYAQGGEVYWNCMNNVNITNNVMLTENNYVLDGSGLNSSKVRYNYNLYFNASGGSNIFRYWNSGSSTVYQTLAAALASANNPGTWDLNSFSQSPLIANFLTGNFTPAGNSVLCGAASDGGDIGAVSCAAYIYRNVSVAITSANNTLLLGVDTFQVNYTVNGTEPLYCNFYIDGIYYNNQSTPSEGNYNITGSISVGTHTYYLTCYDELFSESTTGVYSITLEKALINGTRFSYAGSDNACVGSNCGAGNGGSAYDGNLSTKADYIVGSSQYISNLYINYTNPNGLLDADLYYFLYCVGTNYSGSVGLDSDNYNTGRVMLNGYLIDTGFKANYLSIYNGTSYEAIGGTHICGAGGSGTHSIYETYINYTLNYAINFSNVNNSYSLRNQNTFISGSLLNPNSLGNQVAYTLYVYNSTNSIVYTTSFNATNNISVPVNLTSNGIYRYNVTAENNTHYAISELYTLTIYDFTTTIISPTSNENFNNTLLINWTNTFTGGSITSIVGSNITIDGRLIANIAGNSSIYLWNNTYNWNLSLGTHTIAVNVVDNTSVNTNTTVSVNHTYNTRINITARTAIGGSTINSYSGWVYQSENGINVSYSTTTGQALVDFARGNITVYIEATNYSILTSSNYASFNLTTGFYDLTFLQYETNALNVTFYDEANPSVLLTGVSINLELISDLASGSYNTTNGTMYLPLLTAETYTLRYTAPRYTTRFYTVTITDDSFQNIQLYLLNSTISQNISIYVVNQVLNPVENAVVKALKYNLPTNSYILQEIGTTDVNGRVLMTLTMNDEYYKFIVEYPSGTVQTITDPAYIISNTLTIGINSASDLMEEYQNYKSITYDLSFNTLSNNFRLDYSDANNLASQYCLYVYQINNASQELYGVDCETGASGTILIPVENNTGLVYEAKAVYTENGVQKFLGSLIKEFPWINGLANQFGLFLQMLISLAFASLFILNAGLAIIGLGFSLILGKIIGISLFSWGGLVAIQITCVIMAILLAMKK